MSTAQANVGTGRGRGGLAEAEQAGREIQDVLVQRGPAAFGFVAGSTTLGVVGAQEVADRVLPLIPNMGREPDSAGEFAVSSLVKMVVAGVLGAASTGRLPVVPRLSGLPLAIVAFAGVGALASSGADLVNAVQRTGFLAESPYADVTSSTTGNSQTETAANSAEVRV